MALIKLIGFIKGSPADQIAADDFSVRWTGQVQPRMGGIYTFYLATDDGGRLWVNGQLLVDAWVRLKKKKTNTKKKQKKKGVRKRENDKN